MAVKTRAAKPVKHANRAATTKPTRTHASNTTGSDVRVIARPYLAPLGRSEVGVNVIRKAVRQAAKQSLKSSAKALKKTAKAL